MREGELTNATNKLLLMVMLYQRGGCGGEISFVSGERESIIVFYFFSLLLSVLRSIICNETPDFERDIFLKCVS